MKKKIARIPKVRTEGSRKEREVPGGSPALLDAKINRMLNDLLPET